MYQMKGLIPDKPAAVKILDNFGRTLYKFSYNQKEEATLDVEALVSGIYYIQLEQGIKKFEYRFIKL